MNQKEFNISELKIESAREVEQLVGLLTINGYEVQVSPVYETEDEYKKRVKNYGYRKPRPIIKHYLVKLVGVAQRPIVSTSGVECDDEEF